MYREITSKLERWQNNPRRKPLLLTGVRQCGKTYIVEEFAKTNFDNYVHINFEESESMRGLFD